MEQCQSVFVPQLLQAGLPLPFLRLLLALRLRHRHHHREGHAVGGGKGVEPADVIGREEIRVLRLEAAGERGNGAGKGESGEAVEVDASAERGDAAGVLPDGVERAAERRGRNKLEREPDNRAEKDRGERESLRVRQVDADPRQIEARNAAHAVGAVEGVPFEGEFLRSVSPLLAIFHWAKAARSNAPINTAVTTPGTSKLFLSIVVGDAGCFGSMIVSLNGEMSTIDSVSEASLKLAISAEDV